MRLIANGLRSVRGARTLFSGLALNVDAGEALLVTGANGAGKTTLLRIIAGFLLPAQGAIRLEQGAPELSLAEQCHYVGHLNAVKAGLSVEENARFWCAYLGGEPGAVVEGLATFSLLALRDTPASYLSAGQRRRLALARVLLAPRPLWLLDEPTASLDASGRDLLLGVVAAHLARGGLVVAATHERLALAGSRNLSLGEPAPA